MKHPAIKIQSFSDIITNSSSEIFIINTPMSKDKFENWWRKTLKEYEPWYRESLTNKYWHNTDDTFGVVEEKNGGIEVGYPVICNVGQEARKQLENKFGKENVIYTDY